MPDVGSVVSLFVLVALAAVFLGMLAYLVTSGARQRRRLETEVQGRFGQTPGQPADLDATRQLWTLFESARLRGDEPDTAPCLDAQTWDDLEMDAVFARLDACESAVGKKYLYLLLHLPCLDVRRRSLLAQRQQLADWLTDNPDVRLELQCPAHARRAHGDACGQQHPGRAQVRPGRVQG